MCGRCLITLSSWPLTAIVAPSLRPSWLPGENAFSMQACSSWLFPPRLGMVSKVPCAVDVPWSFTTHGSQTRSAPEWGLPMALDSRSTETSFTELLVNVVSLEM